MESSTTKRFKLPFFDTSPQRDIQLAISYIPFFWLIGVAQIIWPVLTLLFWIKSFLKKRVVHSHISLKITVLFLLSFLLSGFFVVEKERYFTFFRDFIVYISASLWLWYIINFVTSKEGLYKIAGTVSLFGLVASLASILAYLNVLQMPYDTNPFGHLLPSSLMRGHIGNVFSWQLIGIPEVELFGDKLRRTKSFFYDAAEAGISYSVILPLQFFWTRVLLPKKQRILGWIVFILSLIGLLSTISRTPVGALFLGMVGLFLHSWFNRGRFKLLKWVAVIAALAVLLIYFLPTVVNFLNTMWTMAIWLRYPDDRLMIYSGNLHGWLERFFFGWGTQRHVKGYSFSVGSHGTFLAMLYKHGMVGFLTYFAIIVSILRELRRLRKSAWVSRDLDIFSQCLFVSFVSILISHLTLDVELDVIGIHFAWMLFALIICGRKIAEQLKNNSSSWPVVSQLPQENVDTRKP